MIELILTIAAGVAVRLAYRYGYVQGGVDEYLRSNRTEVDR